MYQLKTLAKPKPLLKFRKIGALYWRAKIEISWKYIYTKCNIWCIYVWRRQFGEHATNSSKIRSWRCLMTYKTTNFGFNKSKRSKTKLKRTLFEIHKLINQFNNQNIIAYSTHMLLTNEQTTKNRPFLVYLHSILCFVIF